MSNFRYLSLLLILLLTNHVSAQVLPMSLQKQLAKDSAKKAAKPIAKKQVVQKNNTPKKTIKVQFAGSVTDKDISSYSKVQVGSQVWIAENLNVSHFRNGESIAEIENGDDWKKASDEGRPAWCYYYGDAGNGSTYGKLYNWYAVHDPRGLAPEGWHIPSDEEWTTITTYLGGESVAGTKLKSTSGWNSNGNGTNESGLVGLPGGYRANDGTFSDIGQYGYWWSSSEYFPNLAWYRDLYYYDGTINRGNYGKGCGFSVRCVRD